MSWIFWGVVILAVIGWLSEKAERPSPVKAGNRDSVSDELRKLEDSLKAEAGDIPAKIAQIKSKCRDLGIPELALHIYDQIKHYPSWIRNGPPYVCPEVKNPRYRKRGKKGADWESFAFDLGDKSYAMEFESRSFSLPDGEYANHADVSPFSRPSLVAVSGRSF